MTKALVLERRRPRSMHQNMLVVHGAKVATGDALMDAADEDNVHVDDRTIDSYIKRLRQKFKAVDVSFDAIEAIYGLGYRFKET